MLYLCKIQGKMIFKFLTFMLIISLRQHKRTGYGQLTKLRYVMESGKNNFPGTQKPRADGALMNTVSDISTMVEKWISYNQFLQA